jgi:Tol biopolymer transport system component
VFDVTARSRQRPTWLARTTHGWTARTASPPFGRPLVWLAVIALLVVAVVGIVLLAASRPRVPAPFGPARNGVIATSTNGQMFLLDDGGSVLLNVGLGHNRMPVFSPDGTRLAFWSRGDATGPFHLFVADADGRNAVDVTRDAVLVAYDEPFEPPSWSPDGKQLVFAALRAGVSRLYIARADGQGVRRFEASAGVLSWPAWSPDGEFIAFRREASPGVSIDVARPDGSDHRTLVTLDLAQFVGIEAAGSLQAPTWSPDSRLLAYEIWHGDGYGVSVVGLDGKSRDMPGRVVHQLVPAWSPDGAKLAFLTAPALEVVIADRDGGTYRSLGRGLLECEVGWSPDGAFLIGLSARNGCSGLVMVAVDTGDPARVVDFPGQPEWKPSWQRLAP